MSAFLKNRKIVLCSFLAYFCLFILVIRPALSQGEGEEESTSYTVKEYLEENLPFQEGRKLAFDELKGLLTLTDTPSNHKLALQLIREWDIGPKQIYIEAKFLEITITGVEEMGVDWLTRIYDQYSAGGNWYIGSGTANSPNDGLRPDYTGTNLIGSVDDSGLGLWLHKVTLNQHQLRMYIQALQRETKVNLLNAPRITTLSGQQATIQVARVYPYASGVERTRIEYKEDNETWDEWVEVYTIGEKTIGITLDVTPTVMEGSDIITLEIFPEVTKVYTQIDITRHAPEGLGWPVVDTRSVQTSIMVKSGETVVMGGLIEDDEDVTHRKVPILGDIPLIGNLFRYKHVNHEKKNLIILLTATVINPEGEVVQ